MGKIGYFILKILQFVENVEKFSNIYVFIFVFFHFDHENCV